MKQGLEKGLTDPASLAGNAMQRKLYPYPPSDIRYEPTIEETIAQVEAVTMEQIRRLYAEQVGGQVGEFVAIGEFDTSSTRTLSVVQPATCGAAASRLKPSSTSNCCPWAQATTGDN